MVINIWNITFDTDCWLTYVCAETRRDVEGDGEREVAGGGVEARLHVSSVSSHTDGLPGSPLVLLLDLLLILKAHWILRSIHTNRTLLFTLVLYKNWECSNEQQQEEQTHLQAGNVSFWEVERADDVLTESVNGLEDAELCHFPTHIGDIKHVWT